MKNILFIHQHYYPEMAGTARRTKEVAEALAKNNTVSVITSYPRKNRSMPYEKIKMAEKINGVNVFRIKTYINVGKNSLLRMVSYFLSSLLTIKFIIKNIKNYDILISVSPIASGIAGAVINKFYKIHHHFDVPDVLPDLGIASGMLKNKLFIKLLYVIEKWVYKYSNSISVLTNNQLKNLVQKGVDTSKLNLISDFIDKDYFQKHSKIKIIDNDIDSKVITFVGNIGVLQDPDIFVDIMKEINMEKIHKVKFRFIGDGIMKSHLQKRVINEDVQNIYFLDTVDRSLIYNYLYSSDILISNYINNPTLENYIPGKIFEYILCGKPIVMGGKGEVKKLIEKFDAGISVDPGSVLKLKMAIYAILSNEKKFKPKINEFLEEYNLNKVVDKFDKIIEYQ